MKGFSVHVQPIKAIFPVEKDEMHVSIKTLVFRSGRNIASCRIFPDSYRLCQCPPTPTVRNGLLKLGDFRDQRSLALRRGRAVGNERHHQCTSSHAACLRAEPLRTSTQIARERERERATFLESAARRAPSAGASLRRDSGPLNRDSGPLKRDSGEVSRRTSLQL